MFLYSCNSNQEQNRNDEKNQEIEDSYDENPIIGKWKLQIHQKSDSSKTEINLKEQPTELVLSIMEGGYFVVYDTFIDPKFSQKGFNRIYERSKGQWELIDKNQLVLHHIVEDSNYIENLQITKLNKNTLVTKGKDKKSNIYKTYSGY